MSRIAKASIVFLLLIVAIVLATTFGTPRFSCEVCVVFDGARQCRTAVGDEREPTVALATDNACAFLAHGRAESIRCGRTPPDHVECTDRGE